MKKTFYANSIFLLLWIKDASALDIPSSPTSRELKQNPSTRGHMTISSGRSNYCSGINGGSSSSMITNRKYVLQKLITGATVAVGLPLILPDGAHASNLPASTGADQSKTGTVEKLRPIVAMKDSLLDAQSILKSNRGATSMDQDTLKKLSIALKSIPNEEKKFKRIFDEYSDPVSYNSKYLDQNAFLVYYTKGFDGPNRDSIESGEISKQTLQYGARNDAWTAVEEMMVEINFAIKDLESSSPPDEILDLLDKAIATFDAYLNLAPTEDILIAKKLIN